MLRSVALNLALMFATYASAWLSLFLFDARRDGQAGMLLLPIFIVSWIVVPLLTFQVMGTTSGLWRFIAFLVGAVGVIAPIVSFLACRLAPYDYNR